MTSIAVEGKVKATIRKRGASPLYMCKIPRGAEKTREKGST